MLDDVRNGADAQAKAALSKLVREYAGLVHSIALRFQGMGLPVEDLVSEGNIGLMHAAEKFEITKGAKFSTYAVYWIHHYVRRALDNQGHMIRIPCRTVDQVRKLRQTRSVLQSELGREPTYAELGKRAGFSEQQARSLSFRDVSACSLPRTKDRDGGADRERDLPDLHDHTPEKLLAVEESSRFVHKLIGSLDDREHRIILMYYGLVPGGPKTHKAISKHLGISGERVRQIQKRCLEKLRPLCRANIEDLRPLLAI